MSTAPNAPHQEFELGLIMASDILIVDDEADIRELVSGILEDEGFSTRTARNSDEALVAIEARRPHLIFLDIWMQGSKLDGLQLLEVIKRHHETLPVVMISGHGNIETAVTAIGQGPMISSKSRSRPTGCVGGRVTGCCTGPAVLGPPSTIKAASTPSTAVTMRPGCPEWATATTGNSPRSPATIPIPAGRCSGRACGGFRRAGQHYCPTGPAGALDDYLFWTDENSLIHVWDLEHGLYVDTLLEDGSRGPVPSPYTVWVELFNSRVFRHPKTGKVYLLAASDAIHIFEVLGMEQKPVRFDGEFTLSEADLQSAQRQEAARTAPRQRTLVIRRAAGPVTIDGDLSAFAHAPAVSLVLQRARPGHCPADVRRPVPVPGLRRDRRFALEKRRQRPFDALQDGRHDRLWLGLGGENGPSQP